MLIDTDVLIWNLRGNAKAAAFLDSRDGFMLSAVTYMELAQGMRSKAELATLKQALRYWGASVLPIDQDVSARAMFLMELHAFGHGLQLADALIAASALSAGLPLVTANDKHYRMIEGIELKIFRP